MINQVFSLFLIQIFFSHYHNPLLLTEPTKLEPILTILLSKIATVNYKSCCPILIFVKENWFQNNLILF